MESEEPHFLFVPLLCPGHIIPLVDIARLLGERNAAVTVVVTPLNATRFGPVVDRATKSGLPINFLQLRFPSTEVGLPEGCESVDSLPSLDMAGKFLKAQSMLQEPLEQALQEMRPFPSCIVTDRNIPWIAATAAKFQIPRILFDGMSCFSHVCSHNLHKSKVYESLSDSESFVIPGLPDRIELTKAQLPPVFNPGSNKDLMAFRKTVKAAEAGAFGVLFNSFEELETEYAQAYREATGFKVWCIGPASLCNREILDKAERGRLPAIDENQCTKWLDFQAPGSVIYACFGTLNRIPSSQLIEIAIALEASNRAFIWVIREGYKRSEEMEKWFEEVKYEEKVKGRGLLVRGWAPQVLILSHKAIGGFLTHCGWNSTLEGICAGVPMITWPLFAEQFFNEKLIIQVLAIGVGVGSQQVVMHFGEKEKYGALVKAEDINKAIDKVMDAGEEGERRRKRAAELAAMAEKAVEQGGSSYLNLTLLIEDVIQQVKIQSNQVQRGSQLLA